MTELMMTEEQAKDILEVVEDLRRIWPHQIEIKAAATIIEELVRDIREVVTRDPVSQQQQSVGWVAVVTTLKEATRENPFNEKGATGIESVCNLIRRIVKERDEARSLEAFDKLLLRQELEKKDELIANLREKIGALLQLRKQEDGLL